MQWSVIPNAVPTQSFRVAQHMKEMILPKGDEPRCTSTDCHHACSKNPQSIPVFVLDNCVRIFSRVLPDRFSWQGVVDSEPGTQCRNQGTRRSVLGKAGLNRSWIATAWLHHVGCAQASTTVFCGRGSEPPARWHLELAGFCRKSSSTKAIYKWNLASLKVWPHHCSVSKSWEREVTTQIGSDLSKSQRNI